MKLPRATHLHDSLVDGRSLRYLTIVDTFSREGLAPEVGYRQRAADVIRTLENICMSRPAPMTISCDNGSEFVSLELDLWARRNKVLLDFSRPGKPTDNAFIESFNGRVRQDFLNAHWFESIDEARVSAAAWLADYNTERPHRALANLTPKAFAQAHSQFQPG